MVSITTVTGKMYLRKVVRSRQCYISSLIFTELSCRPIARQPNWGIVRLVINEAIHYNIYHVGVRIRTRSCFDDMVACVFLFFVVFKLFTYLVVNVLWGVSMSPEAS